MKFIEYFIPDSKLIGKIEISENLNKIKFYYAPSYNPCDLDEYSICQQEDLGRFLQTAYYFQISKMGELVLMRPQARERIHFHPKLNHTNQKHTIEFILARANKKRLISDEIYHKILKDVESIIAKRREELPAYNSKIQEISTQFATLNRDSGNLPFKKIESLSDVDEFKDKVVAFITKHNSFYRKKSIRSPLNINIQFARIDKYPPGEWRKHGYCLSLFNGRHSLEVSDYLTEITFLKSASICMRVVTQQELFYLQTMNNLGHGRFDYTSKMRSNLYLVEAINVLQKDDFASIQKSIVHQYQREQGNADTNEIKEVIELRESGGQISTINKFVNC